MNEQLVWSRLIFVLLFIRQASDLATAPDKKKKIYGKKFSQNLTVTDIQ